eukprot:3180748-Pleurochrysis_carterae.AAC.1
MDESQRDGRKVSTLNEPKTSSGPNTHNKPKGLASKAPEGTSHNNTFGNTCTAWSTIRSACKGCCACTHVVAHMEMPYGHAKARRDRGHARAHSHTMRANERTKVLMRAVLVPSAR